MSTDYAAKERAFLDSLKADTGRDLGEWMRAIAEAGLPHRNDTIDWLRQQGFAFSRASWMERIHHNGGRPIYAGAQARPAATRRAPARASSPDGKPPSADPTPTRPPSAGPTTTAPTRNHATAPTAAAQILGATASNVVQLPRPETPAIITPVRDDHASPPLDRSAVAAHLAPAKAYRPLAQHLITAVERAIPALSIRAGDGLLMLCAPRPFAAILPGPRDIRLGLDAGEAALGAHMLRSRLPGAPATFIHTIVLDDARQVNPELIGVLEAARRRIGA